MHPPLDRGELGAVKGRKSNLLLILPHVHNPGKGGGFDLLLQRDVPAVKMDHCSVTAARGTAFCQGVSIPWIL